jgi:hypothetical protein
VGVVSVLLYDAQGEPLITKTDDPVEIPDWFDPQDEQPGVACVSCGCTDEDGCAPDGCFWVAPAICSSCRPDLAEAWTVAPEFVRYVASGQMEPRGNAAVAELLP